MTSMSKLLDLDVLSNMTQTNKIICSFLEKLDIYSGRISSGFPMDLTFIFIAEVLWENILDGKFDQKITPCVCEF